MGLAARAGLNGLLPQAPHAAVLVQRASDNAGKCKYCGREFCRTVQGVGVSYLGADPSGHSAIMLDVHPQGAIPHCMEG